jgi:hypothetical protein
MEVTVTDTQNAASLLTTITTNPGLISSLLLASLGKTREEFCTRYHSAHDNHCAHFVSHILQLRIPHSALCTNVGDNIDYATRNTGFSVRVNQVYNHSSNRRRWNDATPEGNCFVVATIEDNITAEKPLMIGTHPRKHIGIMSDGKVYNFSNTHNKVVSKTMAEFKTHYGNETVLLLADLPA